MSARFEPSSSSSSSNGGRNQNSRPAPFAVDTHQQVGPGHDGDDTQKVDLGHDEVIHNRLIMIMMIHTSRLIVVV